MGSSLKFTIPDSSLLPEPARPHQRETLTTPATTRPITAADLDSFARLDSLYSEAERNAAIDAATNFVERNLGYAVMSQTWTLTIEKAWPVEGVSPFRRPFSSVTSITTVRPTGTNTTWAEADWYRAPGDYIRSLGTAETGLGSADWIEVVYVAGHALAADVPEMLAQSIKIVAAEMLVWNRDVGGPLNMWPGNSWQLASQFMHFRGV